MEKLPQFLCGPLLQFAVSWVISAHGMSTPQILLGCIRCLPIRLDGRIRGRDAKCFTPTPATVHQLLSKNLTHAANYLKYRLAHHLRRPAERYQDRGPLPKPSGAVRRIRISEAIDQLERLVKRQESQALLVMPSKPSRAVAIGAASERGACLLNAAQFLVVS